MLYYYYHFSFLCSVFIYQNRFQSNTYHGNRHEQNLKRYPVYPLSIWVSTRSKWVSIRSTWARICIHFFHFKFQMMANDALLSQLLSFWHYNPT